MTSFNNPEIKAIFVREPDKNQIVQNYLTREGGDLQKYRADISVAYGEWQANNCKKLGINMVESRPWSTSLHRVVESLLYCT